METPLRLLSKLCFLFILVQFALAQEDITILQNNVTLDTDTLTSGVFSYAPEFSSGILRVSVTNTGSTLISAKLQRCHKPDSLFFNEQFDYVDSCDSVSPDQSCELVATVCQYDINATFFISVESGDENTFSITVNDEDLSNSQFLLSNRTYDLNLNATGKYPYYLFRFDFEASNLVDLIAHSEDSALDIFIYNAPADKSCNWIQGSAQVNETYHKKLSLESLPEESKRLYLGIHLFMSQLDIVPVTLKTISSKEIDWVEVKDVPYYGNLIAETRENNYRVHYDIISKTNVVTQYSIHHAAGVQGISKFMASPNQWEDSSTNWECTFEDDIPCEFIFEPCHQMSYDTVSMDVVPLLADLPQVPVSLNVSVMQYDVSSAKVDTLYEVKNANEWTFYSISEDISRWTSDIIEVEIDNIDADKLNVIFSRGGISIGNNCSDSSFTCLDTGKCVGSIIMCDYVRNNGQPFVNINAIPLNSNFNVTFRIKEPTKISFDNPASYEIGPHETHLYHSIDSTESDNAIVVVSRDDDTEGLLEVSIVRVNESICPTHSSCKLDRDGKCQLLLFCVDHTQQPYIRINNLGASAMEYTVTVQSPSSIEIQGNSTTLELNEEAWLYRDFDYGVNIHFSIQPLVNNVQVYLYRNCTQIRDFVCPADEECDILLQRSDETLKGRYWLHLKNETSTEVRVDLSFGLDNCQNTTTSFCGDMGYVDVRGLDIEELDGIAEDTFNTLALASEMDCEELKQYICGVFFPICDDQGMAPAVCKETCLDIVGECQLDSSCPKQYCYTLPNCPIPPPAYQFYSGYIALIVIFGLLILGAIFIAIVYSLPKYRTVDIKK